MQSKPNIFVRRWLGSALIFLFIASILGLLMRLKVFKAIPVLPYKNLLHAHSHTALLGFGFLLIMGIYLFLILPRPINTKRYSRLMYVYVLAGIGMAVSFLYQSYGPISIAFSTIIMLVAYVLVYRFLRDYKKAEPTSQNPLIKWSIYWFLLSTLGIWAVGPVTAILGRTHELYFLSIQFFLHFQFNGWFTFSILGLLIYLAKQRGLDYKVSSTGFWLLNTGLVLMYFLSVTVVRKSAVFFVLTSAGAILQVISYYLILKPIIMHLAHGMNFRKWQTRLLMTGVGCLILKVVLQGLVVVPSLAVISYSVREFIVAYIHLILLGGTTLTASGILLKQGILSDNGWSKSGWIGLAVTFIIMEAVLFGYAVLTWQGMGNALFYIRTIFYVTIPFPVFTACIVIGAWRRPPTTRITKSAS